MTAPRFLEGPTPEYPEDGQGDTVVVLRLLVSVSGSVEKAEVVEGAPPFDAVAQQAALASRFEPASQGGTARAAYVLVRVEFTAPKEEPPPPSAAASPAASSPAVQSTAAAETRNAPESPTQPEQEVSVRGVLRPGAARIMTDAETTILPGAEGDPVRAIESLPGVVPVLASGPFLGLRGAAGGMVGYEYDGIAVPYLFHLGRGPTVLHPWLVESATIYGTGGPARLGRSGGGFLEAKAADPEGRLRAMYRVRATDAALGVEVPFAGGRGSFQAAGRYSYTGPLVGLVAPDFSLDFWDYQARASYDLSSNERIQVLAFGAGDQSAQRQDDGAMQDIFHASFHRVAVRYEHHTPDGSFQRLSTTLGHDRWDSNQSDFRPRFLSGSVRAEGVERVSPALALSYGSDLTVRDQHDQVQPTNGAALISFQRADTNLSAWADVTGMPTGRLTYSVGLRADLFTSSEAPNAPSSIQGSVGPRESISFLVTDFARLHQSFGLGTQARSPAQRPPGRINSVAGGLEWTALSDFGVEWRLPGEVFLDTTVFHNAYFQVGDVDALRFLEGQPPGLTRGQGQAIGLEVALKRTLARRLRGFISYTLSRSERSVGYVTSLAQYDRTHVFDVALAYDFGHGFGLSTRATYYTGFPARVPSVAMLGSDPPRAPDYFQLDWQLGKRWELGKRGSFIAATLGVLNTTLSQEANDATCDSLGCTSHMVGPATIPTLGVEGEL